jgi:hypothetical protein
VETPTDRLNESLRKKAGEVEEVKAQIQHIDTLLTEYGKKRAVLLGTKSKLLDEGRALLFHLDGIPRGPGMDALPVPEKAPLQIELSLDRVRDLYPVGKLPSGGLATQVREMFSLLRKTKAETTILLLTTAHIRIGLRLTGNHIHTLAAVVNQLSNRIQGFDRTDKIVPSPAGVSRSCVLYQLK